MSIVVIANIHDSVAIQGAARLCGMDRHRLKRFRNAFYKRYLEKELALNELLPGQKAHFENSFQFHFLKRGEEFRSQRDGASKIAFQTEQGQLIESVILRIATGRTTLCVSSQVGCAADCAFCATGKMGLLRNLTAAEILDQVVQCGRLLKSEGRRIRNIVFMGMGEPFHNEKNVWAALEILCSSEHFNFDGRRILISTVGIPEPMLRCARRFPRVRMAFSLHSARQEVRERLVPLARRYPLKKLGEALKEVVAIQKQPIFIEYVLLKGINDTPEDLVALKDFLTPISSHINLIPWNPIENAVEWTGTKRSGRELFGAALKEMGFRVTMRYSLGTDIAAACGQLAGDGGRSSDVRGRSIRGLRVSAAIPHRTRPFS